MPRAHSRSKILISLALATIAIGSLARSSKGSTGIQCSLQKLVDSQQSGLVAFTYFVPKGWQGHEVFNWNNQGTYLAEMDAATPDKQYMVDHLEPISLVYVATNGQVTQGVRVTRATDYLRYLVGQLQSQGTIQNPQVIEESNSDLPLEQYQKLEQQSRMIGGMSQNVFRQSGFLKVSVEKDGRPETLTIGTTVAGDLMSNNMTLGYGRSASQYSSENGTYVLGPTVLVVAPTSPNPTRVKEAQIVASSPKMTLKFASYCASLALARAQGAFKATLEKNKELNQEMRNKTESTLQDYKHRWAERDANTHDFCNYLLGQQDYKTPDGGVVTVPSGFSHNWSDGKGNYILSDDPTFDPKGGWDQLEKKQGLN